MSPVNSERVLVSALSGAATDLGIELSLLGGGWILRLRKGACTRYVYGYSFDLNAAAAHQICGDKSATSEVLAMCGLPHVSHHLYLHPSMAQFVPTLRGNWAQMLAFCESHNWNVVVKENTGTGGRGVVRVNNALALEQCTYTLFSRATALCISPFVEAEVELRFILLNGHCEAAFAKLRPSVIGDGRRTTLELLAAQISGDGVSAATRRLLETLDEDAIFMLSRVPARDERFFLNWRHNLGQGASARLLDEADPLRVAHLPLALRAAEALNLTFGSIDMLLTESGPRVLEANAGVMMDFLAQSLNETGAPQPVAQLPAGIYRRALALMFSTADG